MPVVAVTGATGHVGANLVRALLTQGREVRAVVYGDTRSIDGLPVEMVAADVTDPDSLIRALDGAEVVYHLAALISITGEQGGKVTRTNVDGVRNVVNACLACGVKRLVHFSSVHAYLQEPYDQPVDETRGSSDVPGALAYDRSKARGEQEVRKGIEQGLNAVIVNPGSVIGPLDFYGSAMGRVFIKLYRGELPGLVKQGFSWVDVRDVVDGAMKAEKLGPCGEKYILTGHWLSFPDLAALWAEVSGCQVPGFFCPMWLARVGAPFSSLWAKATGKAPLFTTDSLKVLAGNTVFLNDKARRELGFSPRPMRETLADTYEWFRQAEML